MPLIFCIKVRELTMFYVNLCRDGLEETMIKKSVMGKGLHTCLMQWSLGKSLGNLQTSSKTPYASPSMYLL